MASVSPEEKPPTIASTSSSWANLFAQATAFSGFAPFSESQKMISISWPSPASLISSAASWAPSRTSWPCGIWAGP